MPTPLKDYLKKERRTLGIIQIVVAILQLAFAIVMSGDTNKIVIYTGLLYLMPIVFIAGGSLTVALGNNPETRLRKACGIGANLFCFLLAFVMGLLLALDTKENRPSCFPENDDPDCHIEEYTTIKMNLDDAIHRALIAFSVLHGGMCLYYIASFGKPCHHTAATEQNAQESVNLEDPPATIPPQNTNII